MRAEKEAIPTLFHEIEKFAHAQPIEIAPQILTVASSIYRIYDHSVDIADLVMPRLV